MKAIIALSGFVLASLLACPAPVGAQVDHSRHGEGGLKWVVADAIGYGGIGFGLGVLVARAVAGSGGGPVQPPDAAQLSGGSFTSRYALGNLDLVSAPDGTTLAIVAAATMAGAGAGTMIGLHARRIAAGGGYVEGIHRAAVLGGGVLAGGTLGALAAVPLVAGHREGTPLGSDEQTVVLLVGGGAFVGALFVGRYRHELGSRSISVTPSPVGTRKGVDVRVRW
jgi:hypothetical protein